MNPEQMMELIAKMTEELEALKKVSKPVEKKNQKIGKPDASRKYVLLTKKLDDWGKVPQQQQDLATLLGANMEVKKEYTEAEVFNMLIDGCGDYHSLYSSSQDVTYLFKYYRGLSNKDGKHAGFISRNFLRMV